MPRLEEIISSPSNSMGSLLIKAGLWCVSQPYAAAVTLRNWAYDRGFKSSERVQVPVISVGNLTAGGTGKTPMVAYLSRRFRDQDCRVAILSRGYGAGLDGRNDEAKELETLLPDVPHLQSPDRIASAKIAIEELDMQLLILDDGFQHRRIARNLDIVLLDSREPFGFGHILPRGLLREPLRSLKRADLVVATRTDQVSQQQLAEIRTRVQRYNPKLGWVESIHAPKQLRNAEGAILPIDTLRERAVLAVSGIGNPAAFHQTLVDLSARVVDTIVLPDHHLYTAGDIREIGAKAGDLASHANQSSQELLIVCTAKDLTKINVSQIERFPVWALDVEMKITRGAEIFEDRLKQIKIARLSEP
jgi:tetraacyldisaccharide 4'-kinase